MVIDISLKLSVMCGKFAAQLVYGVLAVTGEEQET